MNIPVNSQNTGVTLKIFTTKLPIQYWGIGYITKHQLTLGPLITPLKKWKKCFLPDAITHPPVII
jgi:hypothetical protein